MNRAFSFTAGESCGQSPQLAGCHSIPSLWCKVATFPCILHAIRWPRAISVKIPGLNSELQCMIGCWEFNGQQDPAQHSRCPLTLAFLESSKHSHHRLTIRIVASISEVASYQWSHDRTAPSWEKLVLISPSTIHSQTLGSSSHLLMHMHEHFLFTCGAPRKPRSTVPSITVYVINVSCHSDSWGLADVWEKCAVYLRA